MAKILQPKRRGRKQHWMPPNWVTHLWLINQKHTHLILKKLQALLESYIVSGTFTSRNPISHYGKGSKHVCCCRPGQARPFRPFYGCQWRCSNYGYNVGWWLPDSLIQNKGIFEFGNPIHKLLGSPGDLCARASVHHLLHRVTVVVVHGLMF
jgi:hypothetical protein